MYSLFLIPCHIPLLTGRMATAWFLFPATKNVYVLLHMALAMRICPFPPSKVRIPNGRIGHAR
jgi:hypothetical protein